MIDPTSSAVQMALRGLTAREKAVANNIANVDTPGYKAGRVDFESFLADAIAEGKPEAAGMQVSRSTAAGLPDGNNVNLDEEILTMTDTDLRMGEMTTILNARYRDLRTAIGR